MNFTPKDCCPYKQVCKARRCDVFFSVSADSSLHTRTDAERWVSMMNMIKPMAMMIVLSCHDDYDDDDDDGDDGLSFFAVLSLSSLMMVLFLSCKSTNLVVFEEMVMVMVMVI